MANQQAKQNNKTGGNGKKTRERRLFLKSIFVDADVITEPEEPQKVVVAGLAEARLKKDYPDTFFGRAAAVLRGEFGTLFKGFLYLVVFTLPFILVLTVASGYFESYVLGDSFNFMGNMGIGYPGVSDSLSGSIARRFWEVKEPVLMMLAGAGIIASLGMAGSFYLAKRSYFQDYYKRISRTFFLGIYKYWWKFLVVAAFGILIALAMGTAMLYLLSQQALGTASAGAYCAVVFSFIFGLPLNAYCMVLLSMITVYDLKFRDLIKDALVVTVNNPVTVILTGAISAAPLLLLITGTVFTVIIYIIMAIVGFAFATLCWIALGNRGMTKCRALYAQEISRELAVKKTAKVVYAKNDGPKKKVAPKASYQNPKKKKKK